MEIEVSRRLLGSGFVLLLILSPLLAGVHASPLTDEGRPLLLTPRLARLNTYQQEVQTWVRTFQQIDEGLSTLLADDQADLFAQNERLNGYYQQMNLTVTTLDRTLVPATLEPLHDLLVNTAQAYLDAILLAARWISEPDPENSQAAQSALTASAELLQRLYANPWIEVQP